MALGGPLGDTPKADISDKLTASNKVDTTTSR